MEQGELISYETNLVACYEAEYLLSLQCKTNCHCSDPATSLGDMETMECNSWQNAPEIGMEIKSNAEDEKPNTRKRSHYDADYIHSNSCKTSEMDHSKDNVLNSNGWYSDNVTGYKKCSNNSLEISGQSTPHVKRMCFEAQQCQS